MKRYRIAFDVWGLLLFLLIMLPNFFWFAVPAPQDVLRRGSVTPVLDGIASVCQVLFAAALCAVVNREKERVRFTPPFLAAAGCCALYYAGWILYYQGIVHPLVVSMLTVPPCLAFLFFAIDRKNIWATIPISVFTVCHVLHGLFNFI